MNRRDHLKNYLIACVNEGRFHWTDGPVRALIAIGEDVLIDFKIIGAEALAAGAVAASATIDKVTGRVADAVGGAAKQKLGQVIMDIANSMKR